jgi:hypothetical protein
MNRYRDSYIQIGLGFIAGFFIWALLALSIAAFG